jgi:hypothetical protein
MNENSPEQDAPPPIQPSAAPSSFPTAAPPIGNIGLGQGKLQESDEKMMGLLAHVLGGVTCIIGPLIIWILKKDESPFVNDQGKEALNFQITILIAFVVAGILSFIPFIGCLAALLFPALGVASLVFGILGGIEANKGVVYRYPFSLRLIS